MYGRLPSEVRKRKRRIGRYDLSQKLLMSGSEGRARFAPVTTLGRSSANGTTRVGAFAAHRSFCSSSHRR